MALLTDASLVLADEAEGTFDISGAFGFGLVLDADDVRVAAMARQTDAIGMVIDRSAESVSSASSEDRAGVLTDSVDARFIQSAPLVGSAANCKGFRRSRYNSGKTLVSQSKFSIRKIRKELKSGGAQRFRAFALISEVEEVLTDAFVRFTDVPELTF